MQRIVLYRDESELYSLSFLQQTELPTMVICPNPQLADFLTSLLPQQSTVTCHTISKFLSQQLAEIHEDINILRKADFIAHLGTVFKKVFPQSSLECFFQAFNLFTELRSFTLDIHLIKEVLPHFDSVVGQAVEIFWHYCNHIDLVDEHRGYQLLSEAYRQIDHPILKNSHHRAPVQNIIIWGFSHLSAGQIDLLKALAIYNDVYIPIPKTVYSAARSSDWVRWLSDLPKSEDDLSAHCIDKLKICFFPKNRLAETILDLQSNFETHRHYYLATSKPELEQLAEIPEGEASYRASANIFADAILYAKEELLQWLNKEQESAELDQFLESKMLDAAAKTDYRQLKVWQLYRQQIFEWKQLSEQNELLTNFDLGLIDHIVELNSPRIFARSLVESPHPKISITGVEGLAFHRHGVQPLICVTSSYSSLRKSQDKYTPEVSLFLAAIGPIRRGEFDYAWLKFQLNQVLQQPNAMLFIESGVLERDLAWEDIVSAVGKVESVRPMIKDFARPKDFLAVSLEQPYVLKQRSATRLQSYLDCPRKFYYSYVMPLKCDDDITTVLSSAELGELEHQAIAQYMIQDYRYDEARLRLIIDKQFEKVDLVHPLLSRIDRADYLQEVFLFARNAIRVLCRIAEVHPQSKINLEYPLLRHKNGVGSIDCLIQVDEKIILLDFKRSANSIPNIKELSEFKSLQLWFYFNHLHQDSRKVLLFGYLNLSDISDSLLFAPTEDLHQFYQQQQIVDSSALRLFKEDFINKLSEYQQLEESLVQTIEADLEFAPRPESDSSCLFCQLNNICPRFVYGQNS